MELHLTKLQRGPAMNLVCAVMRCAKNCEEKMTGQINADVAAVILKFKSNATNTNLQVSIRVKKNDKAKKSAVINITCGQFNELILCSNQWIEAIIKEQSKNGHLKYPNGPTVYSYLIKINIIVYDSMSMPLLPSVKLHEDTEFADFQLHTADGTVAVHKAMLFIHSDMFRTMLSGEWKETTEGRINIDGVTVQTLQHLKDYMYLGTLPDEGLEPLLVVATRYLMDKLKAACIAKLVKTIKPENFDCVVELACQNNIPELVKALFLQIPDDVVNGIHKLKIKKESNKSNDTNDKE